MKGYAIDASWDDPFDHLVERRESPRFNFRIRVNITVDDPERQAVIMGPGIVRDVSLSGLMLVTKHRLQPLQRIHLEIPTSACASNLCLPEAFEGTAQVVRVHEVDGAKSHVALRFGDEFAQNMEFVIFIDLLQSMSQVMVSSPRVA